MGSNLHTLIRDLQRRKARERRGLVVAEGLRLVEDALESNARVVGVLAADDVAGGTAADLLGRAAGRGALTQVAPRREFDQIADTETPSGVLAVVEWEPLGLGALTPADGCLLVLDGVQDPGNVGTMIRTAHALGASGTVALDRTADVRNPKVVRGAMGALFRHPVAVAELDAFAAWAERGRYAIWLAVQDGTPAARADRPPRVALVLGSEGHGVRAAWSERAHRRVSVPMRAGAESLNAAVAAGILLYELTRASR
jgi:TrmH family RNA methyltransferase